MEDREPVPAGPQQADRLGGRLIRLPPQRHLHTPSQEVVATKTESKALDDGRRGDVEGCAIV